jgi:hypothetical protein
MTAAESEVGGKAYTALRRNGISPERADQLVRILGKAGVLREDTKPEPETTDPEGDA